jgi:hypothetical protein
MLNLTVIRAAMIVLLLASALMLVAGTPTSQLSTKITGTYTNMYFNQEGGDLLGEELRIVAVPGGYQGTFQVAEGVPESLVLVDVKTNGTNITFSVPTGYLESGAFAGTIQNGVIKGSFLRPDGSAGSAITLQRGKSYWDQ